MLQLAIIEKFGRKTLVAHETEQLDQEAKLAVEMAVRWGMVAALEDGEDSSGRQKLKLLSPAEVCERAFQVAHQMMVKARERGLVVQAPDITAFDNESDA